ncbi:serine protein kinase RIO [Nakamurella sp.]|uniref:serine protein kinase RIO n=1 Tax=Nakamurella sp. TaxID=1869182 RepID=UPI0037837403
MLDRFDTARSAQRARRPRPPSDPRPRIVADGQSGHHSPELDTDHSFDESPYSSYDVATHGPGPAPDWLITSLSARDTRLGILKTGKEADVGLLERAVPGGPGCLLAVKTFRSAEHRLFHRDATYQEGRRVRRSRESRAMAARTGFGRELLAGKWAAAEFAALGMLWSAGARVPYPVQLIGSEVMMEFIGDPDGTAAPRLAAIEAGTAEFTELWHDLVGTLEILAEAGLTHGDLSPYNVLVDVSPSGETHCVVIDLPQVVDLVANPSGAEFLDRDCRNIAEFFARRGVLAADAEILALHLGGLALP